MLFLKKYLLPRIIQYIVVIFIGTTVVFIVPRLTPSDPIEEYLAVITSQGQYLDPDAVEQLRQTLKELYGLEGNIIQQYVGLWSRLFRGDFGPAFSQFPTPVITLIKISLPWTLGLLVISTFISWTIGTILGGLAGFFNRTHWAKFLEVFTMSIRPIPYYIMSLFVVILLAYVFPVFPLAGGYSVGGDVALTWEFLVDIVTHAFLPALSLVILGITTWFLQMRSVTINIVGEDYVVYAEAQGLSKRKIVFGYAMRNAILPQITGLGLSLGMIFGGALITEMVFSYPGVGTLLYNGVTSGDYNLIIGITLFSIIGIATAVLIIDLIYPFLDPRVRYW
ncbi:MAG: ABC transporter permease [bacterium]|nr:ABC transporter permease [bacterium]